MVDITPNVHDSLQRALQVGCWGRGTEIVMVEGGAFWGRWCWKIIKIIQLPTSKKSISAKSHKWFFKTHPYTSSNCALYVCELKKKRRKKNHWYASRKKISSYSVKKKKKSSPHKHVMVIPYPWFVYITVLAVPRKIKSLKFPLTHVSNPEVHNYLN